MKILRKTNLKAYEVAKRLGPDETIKILKDKCLSGRGGAGFLTGLKWEMVKQAQGDEKYVICNADEGEPGTFKDRFIIEKNPETLVEGILIAAQTIGAKKAYIYLRGEYECLKSKLQKAIEKTKKQAKSKLDIEIFMGAGAYVCGDETAIISSIEGLRGHPRFKPPFPTTKGLFGNPTIINNVETLANVPLALMYEDWDQNLRLHCISGDVKRPGIYELPSDTKLSTIINLAIPKNKPKAIYFGCFGGCLPYEGNENMSLTHENVCGEDCMLGACSLIVVDNTRNIVDIAVNIAKFYEFESCGKCTPCREGTMRVLALLQNIAMGTARMDNIETLKELAEVIRDTSFCGLGQTATHHIINSLKFFRHDFEEKLLLAKKKKKKK